MIRRTAGVLGVLVAVALIAAPVALAFNDTITAQATVQFSGAVDNPASCTGATSATIDWGDGTPTSTVTPSRNVVSGTHTYATAGTYSGTVTLTGPAGSGACGLSPGTEDFFTANVSMAPPMFTQCPAVDANNGCQYLITVNNGTETVLQDTNQGPYEGSEDSLIGVQNNSSSPVSELPLAVPGSDLFSFDGDGLCDPGAPPVPSGCVPEPGAPAGTVCTQGTGGACAFPAPAGQPAGYVEPGASSPLTQNGYEGPTSWFSNVSQDTSSGVVHFSPAIPPGGSTYFSLEEPPVGSSIGVGGTAPLSSGMLPPTVSSTGANFSALVNPNGQATTGYFQYGLDLKYSKFGGSGPNYTNSTPVQALPADFNDHTLTASVTGLVPNALYHVRLVATNAAGTTFGPDMTFTTTHGGVPSTPTLGKTFNVSTVSGLVLVKVHGVFIPLTELTQIPKNTVINALHGTLSLTSALPGGSHPAADAAAKGK
ncbi:MAG: PKD domain-containing protein, partial [Solirubrobacteraceae bacterium]